MPGVPIERITTILQSIRSSAENSIWEIPEKSLAIGFSGGIDSSILASLLVRDGRDVKLLAVGRAGSFDIHSAAIAGQILSPDNFLRSTIQESEIENAAKQVASVVTVKSLAHFEDCTGFWLISERVQKMRGVSELISANGPDELFCGYDKFRRIIDLEGYESAQKEIRAALRIAGDLAIQVKSVTSLFGLRICEPFLSEKFRMAALEIPIELKILQGNDFLRKRIWRCFGRLIGLPEEIVLRPKKAMQYGMGVHQIVRKMMKQGTLKLEFKSGKEETGNRHLKRESRS